MRVLFAAEAADESTVRERIAVALAGRRSATPEHDTTGWQLITQHAADLDGDERDRVAQQ